MSRAVALLVVLLALLAPPALAAPPPTLTGEVFTAFGPHPFDDAMTINCSGDENGAVVDYRATGSAGGPYAGSYTETGRIVVERVSEFDASIVSARAEFTIESATRQVSGTARLVAPTDPEFVSVYCDEPVNAGIDASAYQMAYNAVVTTADGVFADRGTTTVKWTKQSPNFPGDFREDFTSSLPSTEQQHSVLFGKRTTGVSWSAMSANTKRASPFVFYFPGTVRRVHAYIDGKGATSGNQAVRAVLYRRDPATGGPGAYVTRSFEFAVPAGMSARWVPFYLAPLATLQPGVYWLGLQSAGQHGIARYAWDSVPNARRYNVDLDADGPSDPFGSSFSDNQQLSIFAFGSY